MSDEKIEERKVCDNCKAVGWEDIELYPMKTMKGLEEYMICLACGAVYRDGNLFGFYKAPKGTFAHIYALEQAADGTTVPRMEFCDQTITVEDKLLNCVLDHKGGRIHQSGITIKGKWIKVEWDLGQKKED